MSATSKPGGPQGLPTTTSSLLLCEALGFSPQLLLDDIINISNNAVQDGVNGMEEFLIQWVEEREQKNAVKALKEPEPPAKGKKGKKKAGEQPKEPEDMTYEIEQGLVAFQTLLEYHTDIAFDFFEAWSLRNIFFIAPELETGGVIVLPNYEGADLTDTPSAGTSKSEERERELADEIEELRKRLDEQRRLTRMLSRALVVSKAAKRRAETRFTKLVAALPFTPSADTPLSHLLTLPQKYLSMYDKISALPPIEASFFQPTFASQSSAPSHSQDSGGAIALTGTGKREWEIGSSGYANWAVGRLVTGARALPAPSANEGGGTTSKRGEDTAKGEMKAGPTWVDQMERVTEYVGGARDVKEALEAFGAKGGEDRKPGAIHDPGEDSMDIDDE